MSDVALITGIRGQTGSYLAELLLSKGYEVWGLVRHTSRQNLVGNLPLDIVPELNLIEGDLMDGHSLRQALKDSHPDEIYNMAAQSFVATSFRQPILTADVNGLGAMRLFDAVREIRPTARIFQASTSEMFGLAQETPQRESTPFHPRSPYGVSKVMAHMAGINYREAYGMSVSNGIMFNNESPRRGLEFVTRKITWTVARMAAGYDETLELGNILARRDWGYSPEYALAAWVMLQEEKPGDYVIATGESHSVEEFAREAFSVAKMEPKYSIDPWMSRPSDVPELRGDPSKAKAKLDWEAKVRFKELVEIMVKADMAANPPEGVRPV